MIRIKIKTRKLIYGCALIVLTVFLGCAESSNVSGVNDDTSSSATANMCTSPTTKIIDFGVRQTAGANVNIRGAFSDIALIPGSNDPAVIFNETNAVAGSAAHLKLMYWDGTELQSEIIVGGVTTTFVRLVFLSTGIPIVFWGNGATALYGAVRSADLSTTGTWSVTALDTSSTVIRAIEASVNPLDQVLVVFMTTTGGAAKVAVCTSSCESLSNYTVSGSVDAGVGTNMNVAGAAWCRASSTLYYPAIAFGDTVNSNFYMCRNATTSNCSTAGNWSTTGAIPNTGANAVATSMYIDDSADDQTIYIAARTGTGVRGYSMASCATGGVAFTDPGANNISNTATVGNTWLRLVRSSGGRFHVVANDAQTMVKYFNQTTASFATGAANSWAQPITPFTETTGAAGLAAAGSIRGGMVADNTGDQILLTYGRTALVTPTQTWANIVVAYNECTNGTGTCTSTTLESPADSTTMAWGNMPFDATGQIQKTVLPFPNTSIAQNSAGVPAVAYVDYSVGGSTEPITGALLKFAIRDGTSATDNWKSYTIRANSAPQSPSLAFDHNNYPWVSWYESATGALRYYLATNGKTDGSGLWKIYSFPFSGTTAGTLPVMNRTVLTMYEASGIKKPLMIILSNGATTKEIRAALFDPSTNQWNYHKQVMTLVGTTTPGGSYLAADYDSDGNIVVAVHDMGTGVLQTNCSPNTSRCIRMGYTTDGGQNWTVTGTGVIFNGAAEGLNIKLNPDTSRPAISFYDRTNNTVKYKYCNTALASCISTSSWADVGVGVLDIAAGVSGLADNGATAAYGLLNTSLTFTSEGYPWVVWSRGAGATSNPHLMFANVSSSTSGLFSSAAALFTNIGVGNISSPVAATAQNFAQSWNPQSIRTITGALHTVFNGPGNYLYVRSCGD